MSDLKAVSEEGRLIAFHSINTALIFSLESCIALRGKTPVRVIGILKVSSFVFLKIWSKS